MCKAATDIKKINYGWVAIKNNVITYRLVINESASIVFLSLYIFVTKELKRF